MIIFWNCQLKKRKCLSYSFQLEGLDHAGASFFLKFITKKHNTTKYVLKNYLSLYIYYKTILQIQ